MSRFPLWCPLIIGAFAMTVSSDPVSAQSEQWREAAEGNPQPATLTLAQDYHGTTPGKGNRLPKVDALKSKEGTWITWPGFLMQGDGSSRVFIQTTQPLKYTLSVKKKRVVLKLDGAKIYLSNNQNPLITRNFNTPLDRTYLKKVRKSAELILELKSEVKPAISQISDADGFHYLFVDLPAGAWSTGDDAPPTPVGGTSDSNDSYDLEDWEVPPGFGKKKEGDAAAPEQGSAVITPSAPAPSAPEYSDRAAEDTPNNDPTTD